MKLAKTMTDQERKAALDEIKRAVRTFDPMPTDKTAREMTPAERESFIKECNRRAG